MPSSSISSSVPPQRIKVSAPSKKQRIVKKSLVRPLVRSLVTTTKSSTSAYDGRLPQQQQQQQWNQNSKVINTTYAAFNNNGRDREKDDDDDDDDDDLFHDLPDDALVNTTSCDTMVTIQSLQRSDHTSIGIPLRCFDATSTSTTTTTTMSANIQVRSHQQHPHDIRSIVSVVMEYQLHERLNALDGNDQVTCELRQLLQQNHIRCLTSVTIHHNNHRPQLQLQQRHRQHPSNIPITVYVPTVDYERGVWDAWQWYEHMSTTTTASRRNDDLDTDMIDESISCANTETKDSNNHSQSRQEIVKWFIRHLSDWTTIQLCEYQLQQSYKKDPIVVLIQDPPITSSKFRQKKQPTAVTTLLFSTVLLVLHRLGLLMPTNGTNQSSSVSHTVYYLWLPEWGNVIQSFRRCAAKVLTSLRCSSYQERSLLSIQQFIRNMMHDSKMTVRITCPDVVVNWLVELGVVGKVQRPAGIFIKLVK
jgi:hypothetical protein